MRTWPFIAVLLIWFSSCKPGGKGSCLTGSGNEKTITEPIAGIHSIAVHNDINIELKIDSAYSLALTGPGKLLGYIERDMANGILTLRNHARCDFLRSYENQFTATVSIPRIDSIYSDGYGSITCEDTIRSPAFTLQIWGSAGSVDLKVNNNRVEAACHLGTADVTIAGETNEASVFSGQYGWLYLDNLRAKTYYINNDSYGDILVYATDHIYYSLSSAGNIQYRGEPTVVEGEITGEGELIHL